MSGDRIFNLEEALARADHDRELFQTMAELFIEHGPKDLSEIKTALDTRDAAAVGRFAHRLKGAMLQFCAPVVLEAAKRMEEAGKAGDLAAGAALYGDLAAGLSHLVGALRRTIEKGNAA